jgi:hypothetical protein
MQPAGASAAHLGAGTDYRAGAQAGGCCQPVAFTGRQAVGGCQPFTVAGRQARGVACCVAQCLAGRCGRGLTVREPAAERAFAGGWDRDAGLHVDQLSVF